MVQFRFSKITSTALHSSCSRTSGRICISINSPLPPASHSHLSHPCLQSKVPPHQAFSVEHYQDGSPTINDQSIWTAAICRGGIDFLLSLQSSFIVSSQIFIADKMFFSSPFLWLHVQRETHNSTWMVQNDTAEQIAQVRTTMPRLVYKKIHFSLKIAML